MASANYQYEPLGSPRSIRVFHLEPAWRRDSPIKGTLAELRLDDNPSFEALSYVWGTNTIKVSINVHGLLLEVTPNCLNALRGLRYRFTRRTLWIDAICIDQKSEAEKNQQVPLMADIYSRAVLVLVWLNDSGRTYEKAGQTMSLIGRIGWMYRLRLIRVYDEHEEVQDYMPKETLLVRICERWITRKAQNLGGQF
jgi:hypothetical protein